MAVRLTFKQLLSLGAHLGHSYSESKFFSSWMLFGWRHNYFLINMVYSLYFLRITIVALRNIVLLRRPIWYINLKRNNTIFIAKYAYLCGESFCVYRWINGSLTNFRDVIGRGNFLCKLTYTNRILFRHFEKKRISSHLGLVFNRSTLPSLGIIFNLKESLNAVTEFRMSYIPTIGIIDSNIIPSDVSIPIPGNDDSYVCNNFFASFFTRLIILNKISLLMKWRKSIRRKKKSDKFIFFYNYLYKKYNIDNKRFNNNNIIIIKSKKIDYDNIFEKFSSNDLLLRWSGTKL